MRVYIPANLVSPVYVPDATETTLIFGVELMSGNASFNEYNACFTGKIAAGNSNALSIDLITNTEQICYEAVIALEQEFLAILQTANIFNISGKSLMVTAEQGQLTFFCPVITP